MTQIKGKLFNLIKGENPSLLILWVVLAILLPFNEGSMTNGSAFLIQSLILLIFILVLIQSLKNNTLTARINWLEIIFLFSLIWGFIGITFSPYRYSSFLMVLDLIFLGLLYFSLKLNKTGEKSLKIILATIIATALLSAVWAYFQYFVKHIPRVTAGFLDPNYLATLTNIAISFLIAVILFSKISRLYRLLAFGFSILFFGTLLMTKSRGGFLSLIVMLILAIFIRNKKWLIIPLILLIIIIIVPNPLRSHVINQWTNDIYAFKRLDIWKMCFRMMKDKPLLGFTPGNFDLFSPAYNFPVKEAIARYSKIPRQAHNSLLHWSVEMGALGVLLLLAGLVVLFAYTVRLIKGGKKNSPLALAVILALTTIFIQSLVCNNLYNRAIMLFSGMLVFCLQNQLPSPRRKKGSFPLFRSYKLSFRFENKTIFNLSAISVTIIAFILMVFIPFYGQYTSDVAKSYLSKSHLKLKDLQKGTKKLQLAMKLVPYQAYYHKDMADLYRNFFAFSSNINSKHSSNLSTFYYAHRFYARAIDINPVESEFYLNRIKLYSTLLEKGYYSPEMYSKIEKDFVRFFELRPNNAFSYFDFARFCLATNQIEKAKNNLLRAVELEPNFIEAHYYLMRIYGTIGDDVKEERERIIYYNLYSKFHNYPLGDDLYLKRLLLIPQNSEGPN